ncbi:collagenase-like, partial [Toxorhynchites rutilus septentrionalis]|uniref:collagenase-like n=1 Tax=Toxorhynchites rutilus septentrionalis TaxID=329112 RepID=UPI002479D1E1
IRQFRRCYPAKYKHRLDQKRQRTVSHTSIQGLWNNHPASVRHSNSKQNVISGSRLNGSIWTPNIKIGTSPQSSISILQAVDVCRMQILILLSLFVAAGATTTDLTNHRRNPRITEGTVAQPDDIPWAVGVFILGGSRHSFCNGALISRRHVLSAASCIGSHTTLSIALGASSMTNVEQVIGVSRVLPHPGYSSFFNRDDIALLTMAEDASINAHVQPVALPRRSDIGKSFVNWMATTAGWGQTGNRDNEMIPNENLHFVMDVIKSNFVCGFSHTFIRDTHVCTATDEGGPCDGDEGGPVTVREAGRIFLIGIHSFHYSGLRGCDRGRTAVHTRVTEYLDWIEENSGIAVPN